MELHHVDLEATSACFSSPVDGHHELHLIPLERQHRLNEINARLMVYYCSCSTNRSSQFVTFCEVSTKKEKPDQNKLILFLSLMLSPEGSRGLYRCLMVSCIFYLNVI